MKSEMKSSLLHIFPAINYKYVLKMYPDKHLNEKYLVLLISAFIFMPVEKMVAQEKIVADNLKDIITKKQFTFLAETAVPSNFRSRPLTFGYDVQFAPDSVISHLPYFGRAYSAPVDPLKGDSIYLYRFHLPD